jgi:hypothetical protein
LLVALTCLVARDMLKLPATKLEITEAQINDLRHLQERYRNKKSQKESDESEMMMGEEGGSMESTDSAGSNILGEFEQIEQERIKNRAKMSARERIGL